MLLLAERLVGVTRTRRASPSSCSLTALSFALRLVATRGWAASTACHVGGLGGAWISAAASSAGSCGCARGGCDRLEATRTRRVRSAPNPSPHHMWQFGAGHRRRHCTSRTEATESTRGAALAASSTDVVEDAARSAEDVAGSGAGGGHRAGSEGKRGNKGGSGGVSFGSPATKMLRLSKLLADRAVGTRTEVDAMVRQGRIKVDGSVVRSPKTKLPVDSIIEVNGEVCGPVPLLVAYHKPKGVITTMNDDWDREDLSTVLPRSLLLKHHPVGRLDADSSGLLLLSSDGALTHKLLSPRYNIEREYAASVDVPALDNEPGEALVAALEEGVQTADGVYKADVPGIEGRTVRVVVREGKNRMVRRMLANAGYPVLELRRERYGEILLGDLPEGEYRPVSGEALIWARSVLEGHLKDTEEGSGKDGDRAAPQ